MDDTLSTIGANDLEVGVELYKSLNLSAIDLKEPWRFSALREISEYLNSIPDAAFVVRKVVSTNKNPQRSNLEHLASYVRLSKDKMATENKIKELEKQLKYYG
jgi:hypothetical protein